MVNVKPVQVGKNTRMSFAKIDEVLEMPNLIEVQKNSYNWTKDFCMSREERNRISFYVACIGAFAGRFSVSNAFAYNYLSQYKGLDFIYDFYDIEHTFSIDDVVDDMVKVCYRNGGPLS